MPSQPEQSSVTLPAHCNLVAAKALLRELTDGPATAVDASQVEDLGQAVLQLLVAARRSAAANGQTFQISSPSDAFAARVSLCGLSGELGIEEQGN